MMLNKTFSENLLLILEKENSLKTEEEILTEKEIQITLCRSAKLNQACSNFLNSFEEISFPAIELSDLAFHVNHPRIPRIKNFFLENNILNTNYTLYKSYEIGPLRLLNNSSVYVVFGYDYPIPDKKHLKRYFVVFHDPKNKFDFIDVTGMLDNDYNELLSFCQNKIVNILNCF